MNEYELEMKKEADADRRAREQAEAHEFKKHLWDAQTLISLMTFSARNLVKDMPTKELKKDAEDILNHLNNAFSELLQVEAKFERRN